MKTGSGNTESLKRPIEESLVKEFDSKRSKTEEASKESTPTEAAIRSKILEFLAKGLDSEKIVNALGKVKGLSSFSPANLLKIVQPVVDSMAKSPELSGSNKASAEKLFNFVEKKIGDEEKENHGANSAEKLPNKDLRVPTVDNQNPKSAQESPRQESAQASPIQGSAQAPKTHVEKVTTTTNSGTGRSL